MGVWCAHSTVIPSVIGTVNLSTLGCPNLSDPTDPDSATPRDQSKRVVCDAAFWMDVGYHDEAPHHHRDGTCCVGDGPKSEREQARERANMTTKATHTT